MLKQVSMFFQWSWVDTRHVNSFAPLIFVFVGVQYTSYRGHIGCGIYARFRNRVRWMAFIWLCAYGRLYSSQKHAVCGGRVTNNEMRSDLSFVNSHFSNLRYFRFGFEFLPFVMISMCWINVYLRFVTISGVAEKGSIEWLGIFNFNLELNWSTFPHITLFRWFCVWDGLSYCCVEKDPAKTVSKTLRINNVDLFCCVLSRVNCVISN